MKDGKATLGLKTWCDDQFDKACDALRVVTNKEAQARIQEKLVRDMSNKAQVSKEEEKMEKLSCFFSNHFQNMFNYCPPIAKSGLGFEGYTDYVEGVEECRFCLRAPCLLDDYYDFLFRDVAEPMELAGMSNKEIRFQLYSGSIRLWRGYMGGGNRVRVPRCMMTEIKDHYPDPEGKYVGFKPSAKQAKKQMEIYLSSDTDTDTELDGEKIAVDKDREMDEALDSALSGPCGDTPPKRMVNGNKVVAVANADATDATDDSKPAADDSKPAADEPATDNSKPAAVDDSKEKTSAVAADGLAFSPVETSKKSKKRTIQHWFPTFKDVPEQKNKKPLLSKMKGWPKEDNSKNDKLQPPPPMAL
ncbi:hypothetical protein SEMRO_64_G036250.1 [Seminavis robusta]|uniref:Uncharacterized protein n=1 Tax=Seminavis robusta TaxID=568900 RepID=A0A9N8H4I8_9STRA|nr:hypothetical protein SEMRO_64_G036250.1 [Seminavis robusta]|eukprot:Sro64_g036250.1 n/a (360) ;mRNA; r:53336-54415